MIHILCLSLQSIHEMVTGKIGAMCATAISAKTAQVVL